jgi:hypothetical protein
VDAIGSDGDCEQTFVAFLHGGTLVGCLVAGGVGEDKFGGTVAENLEAVVEVLAGSEVLGAEAGGGVVDLDERNDLVGMVTDSRIDKRGVAAGERKQSDRRREETGKTHEVLGYQEALVARAT